MITRAVKQLKEALLQEQAMYDEVLHLENNKAEIIKKGKVKELEEITKREQQYIMKMGTFERIRRSVFVNTAEELQVNDINSLSEFLLHLEDQQVIEELDEMRNQLLKTINQIHQANQLNQKLIEQHLEHIEISLDLMTSHLTDGNNNNYSNKMKDKGKTKSSLFDARV